MLQITILDNELSNQYNNVINKLISMENKYFRDVPPNIIISLYDLIYITKPHYLSNKYNIVLFISSNKTSIYILNTYMNNRNNTNELCRTDSTILTSNYNSNPNPISPNKYNQIADYILYLHHMIIS